MDFSLSKEDEGFRQEVREFLAKEVPPDWMERGFSRTKSLSDEEYRKLRRQLAGKAAERGWLAMTWPKEYGGSNASHIRSMIFSEEVVYAGAPVRDAAGIDYVGTLLMQFGTEEQKRRHLLPIARGETFWAEGLSEPEAGSDLAGVQLRAVETGDDWVLNGQKIWTSGAHLADWVFLLVRTDLDVEKHRGLSVILADLKTPGITLRPILDMNGDHVWNEVFFDDVKLPKDSLVGGKNQGWPIMWAVLTVERVVLNVMASARRYFEILVKYLKENQPDTLQNPAVRRRLSQQIVEFNVTRGFGYQVAWMEDNGLDCTSESPIYKVLSGDCLRHVTDLAMELLGPYSQLVVESWRVPVGGTIPAAYLDSFGWSLAGGSHEIQRNIIARRGLELPSERTRVTLHDRKLDSSLI